jgi:3-oxoacyl-[acyl-carrier protein] reductase
MQLNQVLAIVTGAGSGMGRCFAVELARGGGAVVAADVNAAGLAGTVEAASGLPGRLVALEADVSNEASVTNLIAAARERLGGLNVLVNNAGIFRDGLLVRVDRDSGKVKGTMSLDDWNKVLAVDLTGPFLCTREFSKACVDHGVRDAVVVNISSVSRHGNLGQSNYSAAKAGLVADTKLWAGELARYGIRVGAIAPGFIQTPILDGMKPEMLEKMLSSVPLRRAGTTEEIWAGLRFIIECGYFTGRCIDIDGGLTV